MRKWGIKIDEMMSGPTAVSQITQIIEIRLRREHRGFYTCCESANGLAAETHQL